LHFDTCTTAAAIKAAVPLDFRETLQVGFVSLADDAYREFGRGVHERENYSFFIA
jgi:hypothetical protein